MLITVAREQRKKFLFPQTSSAMTALNKVYVSSKLCQRIALRSEQLQTQSGKNNYVSELWMDFSAQNSVLEVVPVVPTGFFLSQISKI